MIGQFNIDAVGGAHWESEKLIVHFNGGRFQVMSGPDARALWSILEANAVTVESSAAE